MTNNPWGDACRIIRKVMGWSQQKMAEELFNSASAQKIISRIETGDKLPSETERVVISKKLIDCRSKKKFPTGPVEAHVEFYMRQTPTTSAAEFVNYAVTNNEFRSGLSEVYVYLIEDKNHPTIPWSLGFVLKARGVHYIVDTSKINFMRKDDEIFGMKRIQNNRIYEAVPLLDNIAQNFPGAIFIEEIAPNNSSDFSATISFPSILLSHRKVALIGFDQVRSFLKKERPRADV